MAFESCCKCALLSYTKLLPIPKGLKVIWKWKKFEQNCVFSLIFKGLSECSKCYVVAFLVYNYFQNSLRFDFNFENGGIHFEGKNLKPFYEWGKCGTLSCRKSQNSYPFTSTLKNDEIMCVALVAKAEWSKCTLCGIWTLRLFCPNSTLCFCAAFGCNSSIIHWNWENGTLLESCWKDNLFMLNIFSNSPWFKNNFEYGKTRFD